MLDSVRQLDEVERKSRIATELLFLRDQIFIAMNQQLLSCGIYRATHDSFYKKDIQLNAQRVESAFRRMAEIWKNDSVKLHIVNNAWKNHRQAAFMYKTLTIELLDKRLSNVLGLPNTYVLFIANLFPSRADNIIAIFQQVEASQAENTRVSQSLVSQINQQLLLGLVATILVSLGSGLIFSQSVASRLRKIVHNIETMENKDELSSVVGGSDEIAELNQAILDTDEKLRAAEEFQIQMARLIAQDLKKPLDQLSESMQTLKSGGFVSLTANGEERVERTMQEINRLRILVQDLVSLDKICRAGWDLNVTSVDLAEIARVAIDTVQDFAKSVDVEIVSDLADVRVSGDAVRLQQIALNLLTNAIKFSPAHSKIRVETRIDNEFGKLSVIDRGTGIPEEFQPLIFGKFEQVSRADSTEKGGSGLGLAISKKLVESQNGKMGFASKLGQGSTFWMQLPLNSGETIASDIVSSEASAGTTAGRTAGTGPLMTAERPLERDRIRPTLWKKALLLVVLPIFVQLVAIFALQSVIGATRQNVEEFNRISQVTTSNSHLLNALIRGFVFSLLYNATQNKWMLGMAEKERQLVQNHIFKLQEIGHLDLSLANEERGLPQMVNDYIELQNSVIKAEPDADGEKWFGPATHKKTEKILFQLNEPLEKSIAKENQLLTESVISALQMQKSVEQVIIISMFGSFLVSAVLGVFIIRELNSRVQRIVKNAQRLAERQALEKPLPANDEVAFVDRSFYEAAARLTQLERFKQEIIAITSHEFRTPLTSLLAKADLIEAGVFGELNDSGRSLAAGAKRTIVDLISIITNLLDVEKIQSGKTIVVKSPSDISTIISDVVQSVERLANEKQVEIACNVDEFSFEVDAVRLTQAVSACLVELINSATEGGEILISANQNGGSVRLSISSPKGSGDPFSISSTSNARGRLAYNLLSLIVEQHGGFFQMESAEPSRLILIHFPHSAI